MKVILIDPTYRHRGSLVKLKRIGYFPLTLPRLAGSFPPDVSLRLVYEKCQDVVLNEPFDIAMFTTMGSNLVRAIELAQAFREKGVKTVVGGHSVLPFLDLCTKEFDSSVIGDGEGLIPKIIEDFRSGSLKQVYENLHPPTGNLPPPRFDLVPAELLGDILPVEGSRGCPNSCDFCAVSELYGSVFRKIPPLQVLRDLEALRVNHPRKLFYFTDPNFAADMSHAKEILRLLTGKGIRWLASVDVRALEDSEFLSLARETGCFCLQVGFETLSRKELAGVNKRFADSGNYERLIGSCIENGIPLAALMIVGFDSDDSRTFRLIPEFIERNRLALGVVHPLIPIPGGKLFRRMNAQGRITGVDPALGDGLHIFYRHPNLPPDLFLDRFWAMNRRLYSLRSIVRRFLHPGVLKNPVAYLILLITNLFYARKVVSSKFPMGLYD